jgi:hypothetical protein
MLVQVVNVFCSGGAEAVAGVGETKKEAIIDKEKQAG